MLIAILTGCGQSVKPASAPNPHVSSPKHPRVTASRPGAVTFGTRLSGGQIRGKASVFAPSKPLAWLVGFPKRPGSQSVVMFFTRLNGPGTHPRTVWQRTLSISGAASASGTATAAQLKAHSLTSGGHFSLAYAYKSDVSTCQLSPASCLAYGTFQIGGSGGGPTTGGY